MQKAHSCMHCILALFPSIWFFPFGRLGRERIGNENCFAWPGIVWQREHNIMQSITLKLKSHYRRKRLCFLYGKRCLMFGSSKMFGIYENISWWLMVFLLSFISYFSSFRFPSIFIVVNTKFEFRLIFHLLSAFIEICVKNQARQQSSGSTSTTQDKRQRTIIILLSEKRKQRVNSKWNSIG